jgi:sigma-E factor negative regulatory protein RseA
MRIENMSEANKRETLSALVDGELSAEDESRLLDQLLDDVSLRRRWSTYHLIGDVMRKHVIDQHSLKHQLEQLAEAPTPALKVTPGARGGLGPLAGLAIAASVALLAVLGIFATTDGKNGSLEVAQQSPVIRVPAAPRPEPSSIIAGAVGVDLARMTWNDATPSVTNRLNGYLVTHNEYLSNGMRGMLPYARIVAYDQGRN